MNTPVQGSMRAMVLKQFGEEVAYETVSRPVPGKGQVLVKISHSGLNPLDLKIKAGAAAHAKVHLPFILGIDMAGTVVEAGAGVSRFKPSDEVYGMVGGVGTNQGTLAEYVVGDAEHIALKPANISMKEAAAIPLVFITAWEGLVDRAKVNADHKVLVHGGAGGVGHMAVQIAKAFGADVYATDPGSGHDYLRSTGVTPIDFNKTSPEEYLEIYTKSEGFDIVFDAVGGAVLDGSFKSVRNYTGHVVSALGWGTHSIAPLSFRGATYSGIFTLLPLLTGKGKAHHGEILQNATRLIEAGKLKPLIDESDFDLEHANSAYRSMEKKITKGKVVVRVV